MAVTVRVIPASDGDREVIHGLIIPGGALNITRANGGSAVLNDTLWGFEHRSCPAAVLWCTSYGDDVVSCSQGGGVIVGGDRCVLNSVDDPDILHVLLVSIWITPAGHKGVDVLAGRRRVEIDLTACYLGSGVSDGDGARADAGALVYAIVWDAGHGDGVTGTCV